MFFYLLLLFTLVPFVELALLLWLAGQVGWLETLLLVIATGILGATLARWQGLQTMFRIQREMQAGRMPGDALVDGALILVAGAVLLTPGILTDAFGFALLVPPIRNAMKRAAKGWFKKHVQVQLHASGPGPHVVDADVIDVQSRPLD